MARHADIIRPVKLTTTLPEDVRTKLDLFLFSDLEGRIPKGAYQTFLVDRIRDFFDSRSLDIGTFAGLPTSAVVRGSPETIALLEVLLRRNPNAQP
jgi:hypothetical protein